MALKESLSIPLGTLMWSFGLRDPDGTLYRSGELFGEKGLVVVFTCRYCPYARAVFPRLVRLASFARELGINTVAINPNIHLGYPGDSPQSMKEQIEELGIDFPYLVDGTQEIARACKVQYTPDIYALDVEGRLVYHTRVDGNWKDQTKVRGHELREAIENLAKGKPSPATSFPQLGALSNGRIEVATGPLSE